MSIFIITKKGHLKWMYKNMNDNLKDFKRIKEDKKNDTNTIGIVTEKEDFFEEGDVILMIGECRNDSNDCWLFDSTCFGHICANQMMFDTYNDCQVGIMKMANGDIVNVNGIGSVKCKFHNGSIKTLKDMKYVLALKKNLISLVKLDVMEYGYLLETES